MGPESVRGCNQSAVSNERKKSKKIEDYKCVKRALNEALCEYPAFSILKQIYSSSHNRSKCETSLPSVSVFDA